MNTKMANTTTSNYASFHNQLASIMEVLANAAVAEICQLVDDGYGSLRLEISRTQRENLALKSKLRLLEIRGARAPSSSASSSSSTKRSPTTTTTTVPPVSALITCTRKGHVGEKHPASPKPAGRSSTLETAGSHMKPAGRSSTLETAGSHMPRCVVPVNPDVLVIKEERRLEDEPTGCSVAEDRQRTPPGGSVGLLKAAATPSTSDTETPRISLSGQYETEDFTQPPPQRNEDDGLKAQKADSGYDTDIQPTQQPDRHCRLLTRDSAPSCAAYGGRADEVADLSPSQQGVGDVLLCGSFSVGDIAAESGSSTGGDAQTCDTDVPTLKTNKTNGLYGALPPSLLVADWKVEEGAAAAVKIEADALSPWSDGSAFSAGLSLVPLQRNDRDDMQMIHSKLVSDNNNDDDSLSSPSHHRENDSSGSRNGELDAAGGFDSSSFDDLFSSPEVARSLTAPHKDSDAAADGPKEPPPQQQSFPFLSTLGNPSTISSSSAATASSDCLAAATASFRNPSSCSSSLSWDSRYRPFVAANPEQQVFSCQQCGRLFTNTRDLLVHQRSHAGERLFHCPACRKPFLHLHQLKTHQRVHTGEKPFSCTQCGKRFSQSSHIKRHMSVHTGEKRYSCGLCGKRFSQSCSLKVHQAVHTGERPYSCTQCGKSFSVLGNLVRHQSVHIRK